MNKQIKTKDLVTEGRMIHEKFTKRMVNESVEIKNKSGKVIYTYRDDDTLVRANLRGLDLRGANLRGADLRETDLRRANLSDVDLRDADLRGADLYGADLRGADLSEANLFGADLYKAKATQSQLPDIVKILGIEVMQ